MSPDTENVHGNSVREAIKPAILAVAPAMLFSVFVPVATVGLPSAASAALLAARITSIGPTLLLLRGGEGEGASNAKKGRDAEEMVAPKTIQVCACVCAFVCLCVISTVVSPPWLLSLFLAVNSPPL